MFKRHEPEQTVVTPSRVKRRLREVGAEVPADARAIFPVLVVVVGWRKAKEMWEVMCMEQVALAVIKTMPFLPC